MYTERQIGWYKSFKTQTKQIHQVSGKTKHKHYKINFTSTNLLPGTANGVLPVGRVRFWSEWLDEEELEDLKDPRGLASVITLGIRSSEVIGRFQSTELEDSGMPFLLW